MFRTAAGAVASFVTGRSFNEVLFDSRRVRRAAGAVARAAGADVVVADTIRTWGAAAATGLPVIAHLDDLLSERYASLAPGRPTDAPILGYYEARLPRFVRRLADTVAKRLLTVEAGRTHDRESYVACRAAVTALTAVAEADRLSRRTGVTIRALPMAVDPSEPVNPAAAPDDTAVFVGGLDYGPNLEGLRWWRDHVVPELRRRGVLVRLTVIGHTTAENRHEFSDTSIQLLGYVPDLATALRGHRMLVSPVQSGAGVKTKVLDGMSVALPVVTTTAGISGVPAQNGVHVLVADQPSAFADAVIGLAADPRRASDIGRAGQQLLGSQFSTSELTRAWGDAVAAALGGMA
jgi:glycosyltransferase involved in cell wall biosynthesis